MKQPKVLLNLVVVFSSILLACGYVTYRAGAFNTITKAGAQPGDSGSTPATEKKTSAEESASEQPHPGTEEHNPLFFPGSKSPCD